MGRVLVALSGLGVVVLTLLAGVSKADEQVDERWQALLGESQATLPEPRKGMEWFDDIDQALRVACEEKRPIFATLM